MYCTQLVKDKAGARPTIDTIEYNLRYTEKRKPHLCAEKKHCIVIEGNAKKKRNHTVQIYRAET